MLTAQRENSPVETEPIVPRSPTSQSFGRMVTSIEGLRERVQGFTVEQVSDVDQRLRIMTKQLNELQRTLRMLAEIKKCLSRLQKPVQQAAAESLEQGRLAMQFEPVAVQSIAQIGTLLKFRRVIQLLKEARSGAAQPASVVADAKATLVSNPVAPMPEPPNEVATDLPTIHQELAERSVLGHNLVLKSEVLEQMESAFDPAPEDMDFESNEIFPKESAETIFSDDSTASVQQQEIIAEFADTRQEPPSDDVAGLIDTNSRIDEAIFEEFKGTGNMDVNLAISSAEPVKTTVQTNTAASEDADFDQRLLDDLIKDYGEFTILPNANPKAEPKREPKPELTGVTPRPNASAIVPSPQPNLPSPRKDGELDRKLKKLMKDYGEYDLYSRQTPLKLKTGVVAAFLVLTLILSGFYFFSSPKSAVPAGASSTSQPQSSSVAASKETSATGEANHSETLAAPSVSNVEIPRSAEVNASQNVASKLQTKKTK